MLALLLAAAATGAGMADGSRWVCTVSRWEPPHHGITLTVILADDGMPGDKEMQVHWVEQKGYVAMQVMNWSTIPYAATLLWRPDKIGMSVPTGKPDPKGRIRVRSDQGINESLPVEGAVKTLEPTFPGKSWVTFTQPGLISRWWKQTGWHVELSDRQGVLIARKRYDLPDAAWVQAQYDAMDGQLRQMVARYRTDCREVPPTPLDEAF